MNLKEVFLQRYLPERLVPLPQGVLGRKPLSLIKSIKSSVLYFNLLLYNRVSGRGARAVLSHCFRTDHLDGVDKRFIPYLCGNVSKKAGARHLDSFALYKKKKKERRKKKK